MRQRRYKVEEKVFSEINITPLTDVMIVLLVIFMITAPLLNYSSIKVSLPSAKAEPLQAQKSISVYIKQDGTFYLDDQMMNLNSLEIGLKMKLNSSKDKVVLLYSDKLVVLDQVVNVMKTAKSAGAEKIMIATESKDK
jgi:biopolymer transport protein ExbD